MTTLLRIIYYVFIVVLMLILFFILFICYINLTGWKQPSCEIFKLIKTSHVVIYPHTSYSDYFVAKNYYGDRWPDLLEHVKFLITPHIYDYTPFSEEYVDSYGAIKSVSIKQKKGGSVKRIVERLKGEKVFHFAISPKGTIKHGAKWRSGYWWIAKELGVDIAVVGLNYRTKSLELAGILTPSDDKDTDERVLKKWMESIPQLDGK